MAEQKRRRGVREKVSASRNECYTKFASPATVKNVGFLLRVTGKPLDTFKQRGLWSDLVFKSLLAVLSKGTVG